jgi:uncharacterized protein YbjT (DUF2867 family)
MKIKAIITGATGMVGEGVLHECLHHPDVEEVLIINRKPSGFSHPRLKEIIHADFMDLSPVHQQLAGYNACFFCLGVSAIGMKEQDYFRVTHDLTLHVARTLLLLNPDMTFCYVSGAGTDSTEKGRSMWARVKGKTENDLINLGFRTAYAFRPGFMKPTEGMKNTLSFYNYVNWMFPLLRKAFPGHVSTLAEVGQAMIKVVSLQPDKKILEVKDIVAIAAR